MSEESDAFSLRRNGQSHLAEFSQSRFHCMVVYIMGELLSWASYWAHFERRQRESVCRCICVSVGADRITLSNFLTESSNRVGSMPGRAKGPFFSSSAHVQKRQCPLHLCVHSIANQCAGACVPCLCRYGYKFSKNESSNCVVEAM